jgi:4a-hydroxytetrahydrobiopterin dehydratase
MEGDVTSRQIGLQLKAVPQWSKRGLWIRRTYRFAGFQESLDFVNRIARKAEQINHHPDIDIRYSRVTLKLTTHDRGGLTRKDFALARQCDAVFTRHYSS